MKKRLIIFLIIILIAMVVVCIINKEDYENIEPNDVYYKSESNNNVFLANKGTYQWREGNSHVIADAISPTEMEYDVTLNVKKDEIIYFENVEGIIKSVRVYDTKIDSDKIDCNIEFDAVQKYIVVPDIVGEYIIEIYTVCDKGDARYSIKLNIQDVESTEKLQAFIQKLHIM